MGRSKVTVKMVRVDFTLEESEKEKWVKYAESLGMNLAKTIKEAMNKAMYRSGGKDSAVQIAKAVEKQQEQLNELTKKYFEVMDELSEQKRLNFQQIPNAAELKERILFLLKKHPYAREDIEDILQLEKKDCRLLLGELKNDNEVDYDPMTKLWSVPVYERKG